MRAKPHARALPDGSVIFADGRSTIRLCAEDGRWLLFHGSTIHGPKDSLVTKRGALLFVVLNGKVYTLLVKKATQLFKGQSIREQLWPAEGVKV